ncbi:MAG: hypothetical protein QOC94_4429 [Actinoplanes sp.]|nr:hypothetical protein [Actinoplanes sp.]
MTGSTALGMALTVAFVIAAGYAAGRFHQMSRRKTEQADAYREGFDQASETLFPLTVRTEREHLKDAGQ